jgi:hypothetical protein
VSTPSSGRGTAFLRSVLQFLVTANVVASSLIVFTLMMEAICSSENSVVTQTTRRNIPEGGAAVKTSDLTQSENCRRVYHVTSWSAMTRSRTTTPVEGVEGGVSHMPAQVAQTAAARCLLHLNDNVNQLLCASREVCLWIRFWGDEQLTGFTVLRHQTA